MRCVSYTRTIPWRQEEERIEILQQNAVIADYVGRQKGWTLQKKYSDRKNDPKADTAFDQMIRDGMARQYDCVVVYSFYYCGTGFPILRQMLLETLLAAGIHFVVVKEGFDTSEKSREEVANYFEAKRREMHADHFKHWRKAQGDRFVLSNSVPFGYVRPNGYNHMIKDPSVCEYVEGIFRRKIQGESNLKIARWLNEHNVETPFTHRCHLLGRPVDRNVRWGYNHVARLVQNRVYTGVLVDKDGQILTRNSHEPYISEEDFSRLPENQKEEPLKNRENYRNPGPLAAVLWCVNCGARIQRRSNFKTGETWFVCKKGCRKIGPTCFRLSTTEMYDRVLQWLKSEQRLAQKADRYFRNRDFRKERLERREELSKKMKTVLAEMEMEQFRRVPLYEQYSQGQLSKEQYAEQYDSFKRACKELDHKLSEIMKEAHDLEIAFSIKNPWIQLFTQTCIPEELDKYVVHRLIARVEVDVAAIPGQSQISITPKLENWKSLILDAVIKEDLNNGKKEQETDVL